MKKNSTIKKKVVKHLKEDIHESHESIRDDKRLMKKMKQKRAKC